MELAANNKEFVRLVEQMGWSQAEAARQLNMTRGAINHIFMGRSQPSVPTLRLLRLIAAGVEEPEPGRERTAKRRKLEPWAEELVERLRALDAKERKRALEAIEAVISAVAPGGRG